MSILRIKEVLAEKDVTGKELAKQLSLSETAVSNIIMGKSFPRPEVLLRISKLLEVDIRDLFHPTLPASKGSAESLYLKRDGKYIDIGKIDLKKIDQKVK